jgi:hypothetical protein
MLFILQPRYAYISPSCSSFISHLTILNLSHTSQFEAKFTMPRRDKYHGMGDSDRASEREIPKRSQRREEAYFPNGRRPDRYPKGDVSTMPWPYRDEFGRPLTKPQGSPNAWVDGVASFDDFMLREIFSEQHMTYGSDHNVITNAFQIGLVEGLIVQLEGQNRFDFSKLIEKFGNAPGTSYNRQLNKGKMTLLRDKGFGAGKPGMYA